MEFSNLPIYADESGDYLDTLGGLERINPVWGVA
jgi:hypothetical protein